MNTHPPSGNQRPAPAFTLVEVILAIVIALGILVVLLYFYHQATNLRTQALQETERLAAARLLMNKLTLELRALQPASSVGPGFVGRSNFLQFIKADIPSFASWTGGALNRSAAPVTDLKQVSYRLEMIGGTNIVGLLRSEEPMVLSRQLSMAEERTSTNNLADIDSPPVLEEIRYLQFRYWTGTNWTDSWNAFEIPAGVEISISSEANINGADWTDFPGEIFRRVIYLGETSTTGHPLTPRTAANNPLPEEAL